MNQKELRGSTFRTRNPPGVVGVTRSNTRTASITATVRGTAFGRWDAGCVAARFPSDISVDAHYQPATDLPFVGPVVTLHPFRRDPMDAAGARKRVKRLTALIDGLTKEEEAMQAGLGVLTREEWNSYLTATYNTLSVEKFAFAGEWGASAHCWPCLQLVRN
jgi:hypothetical protein